MLVTSIFSFSHNVFYHFQNKFQFLDSIYFVVCICFEFGPVQNFVVWERVKYRTKQGLFSKGSKPDSGHAPSPIYPCRNYVAIYKSTARMRSLNSSSTIQFFFCLRFGKLISGGPKLTLTVLEPSKVAFADNADQDQTAQNVQSDLDLHCPLLSYMLGWNKL